MGEQNISRLAAHYKVVVVDTAVMQSLLTDEDIDGFTFTFTQSIRRQPHPELIVGLVPYKHFKSRKPERITAPDFFVAGGPLHTSYSFDVDEDGITNHFSNLALPREELIEDIDSNDYPYLFLWPHKGRDEYEDYIVYEVFYSESLDANPEFGQSPTRSFGVNGRIKSLSNLNPSPPG